VQEEFAEKSAVFHDHPCTLNELKTAVTAYIRNISKADLQKVFVNKIKRVQARIVTLVHTLINAKRLSNRTVESGNKMWM
jgi:hypothetical protein